MFKPCLLPVFIKGVIFIQNSWQRSFSLSLVEDITPGYSGSSDMHLSGDHIKVLSTGMHIVFGHRQDSTKGLLRGKAIQLQVAFHDNAFLSRLSFTPVKMDGCH